MVLPHRCDVFVEISQSLLVVLFVQSTFNLPFLLSLYHKLVSFHEIFFLIPGF